MDDEIFKDTKSKARDLLMCNLCGSTYQDPRRLPCDHLFCRRCLQVYHDSIRSEGGVRLGSFHCPTCNKLIGIPLGGVSEFPVDGRIGDIKEKVVGEMTDILLKKLHAAKEMSGTGSPSVGFFKDTQAQNSNTFSEARTGSHVTDPPTHDDRSRSFGRHQTFADFDSRQKRSETSDAPPPSSRVRFDRQRPMYSSLREIHRRKAQDLLAAFDQKMGISQAGDFLPSSSTSRETYYDASETNYPAYGSKSFNNLSSSRFKTHYAEDATHNFSTRNSRSSDDSAKTNGDGAGSCTNASSSSGYFDDKNSTFLKNHRGYESLREKRSRRTYLGEDTFSHSTRKTAEESTFQETRKSSGDLYGRYTQETDTRFVRVAESEPLLETAAGLKSTSDRKSGSVSDSSYLNRAKNYHVDLDHVSDIELTKCDRPAETTSPDFMNNRNGDIPESISTSQPSVRRNEHFAGLRKSSSSRTKRLDIFSSSLATAHEECVLDGYTSFEETAPSAGTSNRLSCPPDFISTSTSSINAPPDLISNSSNARSSRNEKQTSSEAVDRGTKVSGRVPLKNLYNSRSLEDEVEVLQEFDFLMEQLNEDEEEICMDINGSDSSPAFNCTIDETCLVEEHQKPHGRRSGASATTPSVDASKQCTHDTEVVDSSDEVIIQNGFDKNVFRASNGGPDHAPQGNHVTVERSNGIGNRSSTCTDPLPSPDQFGNEERAKVAAPGKDESSCRIEDDMKIRDGSYVFDDDDDDDDDDDTLVNGKASEEEDNCVDPSPPMSPFDTGDNVKTFGQTRGGTRRVTRRKATVNKGTATLHHVSPDVYLMPTGVAILSQGSTVVADYGIGCLQYYADDGTPLHRIEGMKPFSIAVNSANNQVIIGDRKKKTVCLFDECGCDVAQWDANMFNWICGIGVLRSGDLVILDRERSQIGIYKPNGQWLHTFGSYGNDGRQLCMAEFLVVDGMDRIVVSDSGNHCIKVFSIAGTLLQTFGSRGCGAGEMQWPKGICTDQSNNIIVADACNSRVSMFSSDGNFVQHLVTNISMPYAVSYSSPNVAVTRYSVMGQSQFRLYSIGNKS